MENKTTERACPKCGTPLAVSQSNANRGQVLQCRPCYRRDWYKNNREQVVEDSKKYYQQTRKRRLQVAKARRDALSPAQRKLENRTAAYKRKYGITIAEYDAMVDAQGGLCFLCGKLQTDGERLAVDHCHLTKKVRKLLCKQCNFFLGIIERDSGWLDRAIAYLKSE